VKKGAAGRMRKKKDEAGCEIMRIIILINNPSVSTT